MLCDADAGDDLATPRGAGNARRERPRTLDMSVWASRAALCEPEPGRQCSGFAEGWSRCRGVGLLVTVRAHTPRRWQRANPFPIRDWCASERGHRSGPLGRPQRPHPRHRHQTLSAGSWPAMSNWRSVGKVSGSPACLGVTLARREVYIHVITEYFTMLSVSDANWDTPPGYGYLIFATITISAILTVIMTLRAPKRGADAEPHQDHRSRPYDAADISRSPAAGRARVPSMTTKQLIIGVAAARCRPVPPAGVAFGLVALLDAPLIEALFRWLPDWFFLEEDLSAYARPVLLVTWVLGLVANGLAAPMVEELYSGATCFHASRD
jgi:hypothetical protein